MDYDRINSNTTSHVYQRDSLYVYIQDQNRANGRFRFPFLVVEAAMMTPLPG